jgi:hypothetical protein
VRLDVARWTAEDVHPNLHGGPTADTSGPMLRLSIGLAVGPQYPGRASMRSRPDPPKRGSAFATKKSLQVDRAQWTGFKALLLNAAAVVFRRPAFPNRFFGWDVDSCYEGRPSVAV